MFSQYGYRILPEEIKAYVTVSFFPHRHKHLTYPLNCVTHMQPHLFRGSQEEAVVAKTSTENLRAVLREFSVFSLTAFDLQPAKVEGMTHEFATLNSRVPTMIAASQAASPAPRTKDSPATLMRPSFMTAPPKKPRLPSVPLPAAPVISPPSFAPLKLGASFAPQPPQPQKTPPLKAQKTPIQQPQPAALPKTPSSEAGKMLPPPAQPPKATSSTEVPVPQKKPVKPASSKKSRPSLPDPPATPTPPPEPTPKPSSPRELSPKSNPEPVLAAALEPIVPDPMVAAPPEKIKKPRAPPKPRVKKTAAKDLGSEHPVAVVDPEEIPFVPDLSAAIDSEDLFGIFSVASSQAPSQQTPPLTAASQVAEVPSLPAPVQKAKKRRLA